MYSPLDNQVKTWDRTTGSGTENCINSPTRWPSSSRRFKRRGPVWDRFCKPVTKTLWRMVPTRMTWCHGRSLHWVEKNACSVSMVCKILILTVQLSLTDCFFIPGHTVIIFTDFFLDQRALAHLSKEHTPPLERYQLFLCRVFSWPDCQLNTRFCGEQLSVKVFDHGPTVATRRHWGSKLQSAVQHLNHQAAPVSFNGFSSLYIQYSSLKPLWPWTDQKAKRVKKAVNAMHFCKHGSNTVFRKLHCVLQDPAAHL